MKTTDRDGNFSFTWMDLDVDYEIHAQRGTSISDKLLVLNSDKRPEIVVKLKLEKKTD